MKKLFPLLLIGGAIFLIATRSAIKKITNLSYNLSNIKFGKITGGKFTILLDLEIINPNNDPVTFREINGVVSTTSSLFGGAQTLGNFQYNTPIKLPGKSARTTIKNIKCQAGVANSLLTALTSFLSNKTPQFTIQANVGVEGLPVVHFTKAIAGQQVISGIGETEQVFPETMVIVEKPKITGIG